MLHQIHWLNILTQKRKIYLVVKRLHHEEILMQLFKAIQAVRVRFQDTSGTQQFVTRVIQTATWHQPFPVRFKESC